MFRWIIDRVRTERARRLFCAECGAPQTDVTHTTCSDECADAYLERTAY